jgi:predicted kinase
MQRVIILRGCMGSGKSTLAQKYRSFDSKMAYLKIDDFKNVFDHFEKEVRPIVHGAAKASLDYLLQQGFSVVMEGVFQDPATIEEVIEVSKRNGVLCKVFELKASLKTLQTRDKQREEIKQGTRTPLGDEAIEYMFNKLKGLPYDAVIELDTEKLSVEESKFFIDEQFEK